MALAFKFRIPRRTGTDRDHHHGATRVFAETLVSLAGLVGRPVRNQTGGEIGRIADVVVRWNDAPYPAVTGFVVKVGRRESWLPVGQVAELRSGAVELSSARLDLRDFVPRPGEIALERHVLDHQLIDVDGIRVVRASDLYLARVGGEIRLVGVDVGLSSLVRRLGPQRRRDRPTPSRVIDWGTIQPFSAAGAPVRLARANQALHRLRPAELAELLEELGRAQRQELVEALDPAVAADALEEMSADELDSLLSDMDREKAAAVLAEMAPDEAAEALREMDDTDREELLDELDELDEEGADDLRELLTYDDGTAGSVMTTTLLTVTPEVVVDEVVRLLAARADEHTEHDGVLVVDGGGRLVGLVSLFALLVADRLVPVGTLVGPPEPLTVRADDDLDEVLTNFIDSRGTSLVVVDEGDRPIGRILADDVIDALVDDRRLGRDRRDS